MNKSCKQCNTQFEITQDDQGFYDKIGVPAPSLCPECRYQRRIANRNEWNFYKRNCSLCNKSMVSIYNPDYSGPIYCRECWWSDDWDPLDYGKEYEQDRSFFEQFKEVRFRVPKVTLTNVNSVNSDYTNQSTDNKNCYMAVATGRCEDCMYTNWVVDSKSCVDCYAVEKSEMLYEALNCTNCYKSAYLENCVSCNDSYFLYDCHGCNDCFGSVGLRNKSYYWFNEQLTKEEYKERLKNFEWTNDSIEEIKDKLKELKFKHPHKYYNGRMNTNSSGDYIEEVKNSENVFNARHLEDIKYSQDAWYAKTCLDLTEVWENELDYELEGVGPSARSIVLTKTWETFDSAYTDNCFSCEYVLGCVAVRKKKYCVLNRQYTKEEYEALRKKIVEQMKKDGEWGEFFPVTISPFPYNDTIAQDYFPLTKEEVLAKGWRWYDKPKTEYKVGGDILACTNDQCYGVKAFKLHPEEIKFYEKMGLPTPDKCFPCRLQERLARRNPRKLWHRQCMKEGCPNEFETSYSPERKELVYCETCYNSEIV